MSKARARRTLIGWVAIAALLINAFMPYVAMAGVKTSGGTWVELCSTQGVKRVLLDTGVEQPASAPLAAEHCLYCSVHASALDLPPAPPSAALPARTAEPPPASHSASPENTAPWRGVGSRAPPLLSTR